MRRSWSYIVCYSCWRQIPPKPNTKWGPTSGKKKIFFRPKSSENFFQLVSDQYEQKTKKIFFGLCENLVEILGGVEIFSPEIARKFFWVRFRPIRTKKEKKFFWPFVTPKWVWQRSTEKNTTRKRAKILKRKKNEVGVIAVRNF